MMLLPSYKLLGAESSMNKADPAQEGIANHTRGVALHNQQKN